MCYLNTSVTHLSFDSLTCVHVYSHITEDTTLNFLSLFIPDVTHVWICSGVLGIFLRFQPADKWTPKDGKTTESCYWQCRCKFVVGRNICKLLYTNMVPIWCKIFQEKSKDIFSHSNCKGRISHMWWSITLKLTYENNYPFIEKSIMWHIE